MRIIELFESSPATKQRAAAMGFDTSRVWYHGTTGTDIASFDPTLLGRNTGAKSAGKGFFFASDPDVAASYGKHEHYHPDEFLAKVEANKPRIAELEAEKAALEQRIWGARSEEQDALRQAYTTGPKKKRITPDAYYDGMAAIDAKYDTEENRAASDQWGILQKELTDLKKHASAKPFHAISRAVVHPVYLKMIKPLLYDMQGNHYRETSYNDLLISARRGRRDGAIISNTFDPGYRGADAPMCDIAVVFAPQQIRSIFARFDPSKADSPNISD